MSVKKRRYNNGTYSKVFTEGEQPEGWVPGYTKEESAARIEKTRKTNLERYGVACTFQAESVKEKIKQSMLKNHGVEHALQSKEIMESMKKNNIEKYGVENVSQIQSVLDKKIQTSLERYGTEHPMQSEDIQEKSKKTCLEKYGTEYSFQSEEIKAKKRQSYLEHYGVEHPSQSKEIKDKKIQTCLKHFGVKHPFQSDVVREKIKQTNLERYGTEYPHGSEDILNQTSKTCQQKYGVPWACMRPEARVYSNDSTPNREFAEILEANKIEYEREFHLERYSYDFKIGNTLIEINPSSTHNVLWSPFKNHEPNITQDYHLNKSLTAEKHNFHCIHIFDWTDILSLMKNRTELKLTPEHIYDAEFILHLSIEDFSIENIKNYIKKFVESNNIESIISYCDFSKYRRDVYEHLGFSLNTSLSPRCHWYNPKTKDHIVSSNDHSQLGYVPIYDCGMYSYIWKRGGVRR